MDITETISKNKWQTFVKVQQMAAQTWAQRKVVETHREDKTVSVKARRQALL